MFRSLVVVCALARVAAADTLELSTPAIVTKAIAGDQPVILDVTQRDGACAACNAHDAVIDHALNYPDSGAFALERGDANDVLNKLNEAVESVPALIYISHGRVIGKLGAGLDNDNLVSRWLVTMHHAIAGGGWKTRTPLACGTAIYKNLVVTGKLDAGDLTSAALQHLYALAPASIHGKLSAAQVKAQLGPAFLAYDVYDRPSAANTFPPMLARGDLLAYYAAGQPEENGVFLVEEWDPTTLRLRGRRAWKGGDTELQSFDLSPDPVGVPRRLIRPFLTWLRPLDTKLCDAKRL